MHTTFVILGSIGLICCVLGPWFANLLPDGGSQGPRPD